MLACASYAAAGAGLLANSRSARPKATLLPLLCWRCRGGAAAAHPQRGIAGARHVADARSADGACHASESTQRGATQCAGRAAVRANAAPSPSARSGRSRTYKTNNGLGILASSGRSASLAEDHCDFWS